MKLFTIFKSEGGYRVCGGIVLGCPVISLSPWYLTRRAAQCAANNMKRADSIKAARDINFYLYGEK